MIKEWIPKRKLQLYEDLFQASSHEHWHELNQDKI